MTNPFEVKGHMPQWEMIYVNLVTKKVGEIVTYDQMSAWVGYDIRDNRTAYYQAAKKLREQNRRTLVNKHGVGYVVVDATQHGEIARQHTRKADKQVTKARHVLDNTDYNELPSDLAQRFQAQAQRLGGIQTLTRNLARRQANLEKALKDTRRETKEVTAELADVASRHEERLSRLEKRLRSVEAPQFISPA